MIHANEARRIVRNLTSTQCDIEVVLERLDKIVKKAAEQGNHSTDTIPVSVFIVGKKNVLENHFTELSKTLKDNGYELHYWCVGVGGGAYLKW